MKFQGGKQGRQETQVRKMGNNECAQQMKSQGAVTQGQSEGHGEQHPAKVGHAEEKADIKVRSWTNKDNAEDGRRQRKRTSTRREREVMVKQIQCRGRQWDMKARQRRNKCKARFFKIQIIIAL